MIIVILSYNHPEITARTVRSCLKELNSDQVLLVHNGSTSKHRELLQNEFPTIQHHVLPNNLGFTGGANFGLRQAFQLSDWVLFVTNDCELQTIGPKPSLPGIFAPLIWARREGHMDSLGGEIHLPSGRLRHLKSRNAWIEAKGNLYRQRRLYVPGTAFWIHQNVFQNVGAFDESLGTYWEDVDLSLRIEDAGLTVGIAPETKLIHRIGKTCHKDPTYTTFYFQRNRARISRKHLAKNWLDRSQLEWTLRKDWTLLACKFLKNRDWSRIKLLRQALDETSP